MECAGVTPDSRMTHVMAVQSTAEASQGCSSRDEYRRKVFQLERRVEKLEEVLADKDALIASLRAKNRATTAELIEFQLQKVAT